MKTYIYWNNKEKWHGEKMAEIQAECLFDADKQFYEMFGIKAEKCNFIGAQVLWQPKQDY